MEQPPPVPELTPFWAAVRRRHPDVDLVLLPDPLAAPAVDAQHEVDDGAVDDAMATVQDVLDALVAEGIVDGPGAVRVGFGPRPGTVLVRARATRACTDGPAGLARLREQVSAQGFAVHLPAQGLPRVVGVRDDLRVRASYAAAAGALLVEVVSAPMAVGAGPARRLVRR